LIDKELIEIGNLNAAISQRLFEVAAIECKEQLGTARNCHKSLIDLSAEVVVAWRTNSPPRKHDVQVLSEAGWHHVLETGLIAGGETEDAARFLAQRRIPRLI
jgi:hypothetical protein